MGKKAKTASAGRTAHGGGFKEYAAYTYSNTPVESKQPITTASGKVVGLLINGVFHRNAIGSKHMLRKPRGWAHDTSVLKDLTECCCRLFLITDTETDTAYTAPFDAYTRYGVSINRGFGPQVVLPLGYWSVNGEPPSLGQPLKPVKPSPNKPRQLMLPLFGELAA